MNKRVFVNSRVRVVSNSINNLYNSFIVDLKIPRSLFYNLSQEFTIPIHYNNGKNRRNKHKVDTDNASFMTI